jgi:acyl-CoA synthetase (AMP-forming)/AMP-acid ligase II
VLEPVDPADAALVPGTWPVTGVEVLPGDVDPQVLARTSLRIASGLHAAGLRRGDRLSLLAAPGAERTAVAFACWRLGVVVVVASAGLGRREQLRAHAAARPQAVVADSRGLLLTRALRTPRLRIATERLPVVDGLALGARYHLADLVTRRLLHSLPPQPSPDDDAALVFAATGDEPVGVHYTRSDLVHLRELLEPAEVTATRGAVTHAARPARSPLRELSARVVAGLVVPAFG